MNNAQKILSNMRKYANPGSPLLVSLKAKRSDDERRYRTENAIERIMRLIEETKK